VTTTTIRLPEALKARVERLAAASGGTVHAFMIEAITEIADQRERREAFHAEADKRWKRMARTGEYIAHEDLRAYAMALARGDKPEPPAVRVMEPAELARLRGRVRRAGLK
jgi:predicted transcriptional regulator